MGEYADSTRTVTAPGAKGAERISADMLLAVVSRMAESSGTLSDAAIGACASELEACPRTVEAWDDLARAARWGAVETLGRMVQAALPNAQRIRFDFQLETSDGESFEEMSGLDLVLNAGNGAVATIEVATFEDNEGYWVDAEELEALASALGVRGDGRDLANDDLTLEAAVLDALNALECGVLRDLARRVHRLDASAIEYEFCSHTL